VVRVMSFGDDREVECTIMVIILHSKINQTNKISSGEWCRTLETSQTQASSKAPLIWPFSFVPVQFRQPSTRIAIVTPGR
jgi:hypothetical protein